MSTSRSKSEFEFNGFFSGYSHTKSENEREMDKKLFHGRKSKMAKLRVHGFFEDNSMAAKDRKELRNQMQLKRKQSSMNRLHASFESEVRKVKEIQRKLASHQESMAITALEKYTITFLQSVWRGYLARKYAKEFRSRRFLAGFLVFRRNWQKRSRAGRVIVTNCRKYRLLRILTQFVKPSRAARVIQVAYMRRYLRGRGAIRYKAHQVWDHVKLFGMCRARQALSPYHKQRMVVFNLFLRFHQRIRARRIFNAANVNKLFLGLYFCQKPLAQNAVANSASYLKVSTMSRKQASVLAPALQTMLSRDLHDQLNDNKIEESLQKANLLKEENSIQDTLRFLKHQVKKDSLSNMMKLNAAASVTPLLPGGSGGSGGGSKRRGSRMIKKQVSLGSSGGRSGIVRRTANNRNSQAFVSKNIILESVTAYRKNIQDYKVPRRLIHLSAYSQLDQNSIFASQLSSKTNKVIPYELKGFFRLKTFPEVIQFLQDLASAAIKCPELLDDPFDDINACSCKISKSLDTSRSTDYENVLKDPPDDFTILEFIENFYPTSSLNYSSIEEESSSKLTSKKSGKGGKGYPTRAASPTGGGSRHSILEKQSTMKSDTTVSYTPPSSANSRSSSRLNSANKKSRSDETVSVPIVPRPPLGEKSGMGSYRNRDNVRPVVETILTGESLVEENKEQPDPSAISTSTNVPLVTSPALPSVVPVESVKNEMSSLFTGKVSENEEKSLSEGSVHFEASVKEEESKYFEGIHVVVDKGDLLNEQEKKTRRKSKPQLSVITTPQLSQSTTTVPDLSFLDSPSRMSEASSMKSDDDYDDDFDSISMSRSNNASASGKRPSRPTSPVPSSAYYRRQIGSKKQVNTD